MKTLIALSTLVSLSAFAAPEITEFDSAQIKEIEIQNSSGLIKVQGGTAGKTTVAFDKIKTEGTCITEAKLKGDKLKVVAKAKGFLKTGNCEINITVNGPAAVELDLSSGSGAIEVAGVKGEVEYKAGSGNVNISGEIEKIDGKAGSGSATIKGLKGSAELKSGSGAIDITYTSVPDKGELDIKTGSGRTQVALPAGAKFKSDIKTGSGKATNELGESREAQFKVSFRAGSGDLLIKKVE